MDEQTRDQQGTDHADRVCADDPAGLYIHLPFCREKCLYCDFVTFPLGPQAEPYLAAVEREAAAAAARAEPAFARFDSVYLGGGTPSLLPPAAVARLLDRLRAVFTISPDAEITLESNPEDVNPQAAAAWVAAGVNRVTVGVQTVHADTLIAVRRHGGSAAVTAAVAALREAGVGNIAMDLILGLPDEGPTRWVESLEFCLGLRPDHVSMYLLDVDDHPAVARRIRDGRWRMPPDEAVADFYLNASARLAAAGLPQYEISNFAAPARRSRHNLKYWRLAPYLGLGVAAHSFDGRRRWWNERRLRAYVDCTAASRRAEAGEDAWDWTRRAREFVMLGLRLVDGVSRAEFQRRLGRPFPPEWAAVLKKNIVPSLVLDDNGTFRLTPQGMLVSNEILQELFDAN
ncbi:MAG TPA: radical SAM family heme chaperone HemW [Acidobacteriota bacterium]|nr:radical SAM family heme chaperone HemW [Acidobacteriota bacterium]HQG90571.1 radical SAM family heme chaperone HemW [Acidobacteriota bacterium]HQK86209.1 radical SAM family heme chaperone HemW [Acidobacteriota bacterium]